jgi:hypothetical protein
VWWIVRQFCDGLETCLRIVDQANKIACMKLGSSYYFQPLPISRPPSSHCIRSLNVEVCPICNEDFDFNDICVASCSHNYHPWCLLVHTTCSRKCKAINCGEVFHEGWCFSFGLSKNLVEVTKMEGPKDDLESVQLIPTTSGQNI